MNLLLLEARDFVAPDLALVDDRRCEHVRKIHRAVVGDSVRVGQVNGLIGEGTIEILERERLQLRVQLTASPPPKLPVTLAVALPRPHSLQRVLAYGAAMGVPRFVFFHSARVEKSYWDSHATQQPAVRRHLLLGLEQAVDTVMPTVEMQRRFLPFAEDLLPTLGGPVVVAHPEPAEASAGPTPRPGVVVVGPEGGFVPFELARLMSAGARCHSLGPRILRVETAVVALLSRLA
ncbi:MAG: 16S rRNA (uracil(1498)-N(3))-methyltransferase [Myxococcales bacterium FL481]|nr:MAG: 16S rRNA (uracil(1498)-N(3))-methyltransferase [Myxococcales bacterium FL481]